MPTKRVKSFNINKVLSVCSCALQIVVVTSEFEGAGTLHPIQMSISGDSRSSDMITLPATSTSFAAGQVLVLMSSLLHRGLHLPCGLTVQ